MKPVIILLSAVNILCLFMHEFDACRQGEWKMFRFLRKLKEETQYRLFLFIHVPLTLFAFYYLWTVLEFRNPVLWIVVNGFMMFHLVIHLAALRWKSNVFRNVPSFLFIAGGAVTGLFNLCLAGFYH